MRASFARSSVARSEGAPPPAVSDTQNTALYLPALSFQLTRGRPVELPPWKMTAQ